MLLRGAPGVGKSTVGRTLAEICGNGVICEVDRFRAMFAPVDWGDRRQHSAGLRAAVAAGRSLIADGVGLLIVIDTFGRETLPPVAASLASPNADILAVSLWAEVNVLRSRLAARGDGFSDAALSSLMNAEVRTKRVADDVLIDTSALQANAVAARIIERLDLRPRTARVM
ncbi:MAG: hypothetical protein KC635_24180 [Myxococcales bacterium]|nr:hypothetical protein [Myxococcales bacterium]